jgi:hypothetical protein
MAIPEALQRPLKGEASMPRTDDARTDGALAEVTNLVAGPKGVKIQQLLTDWATGKGKGKTGKSIKLGGKLHSKAEKESRAQVRAVLLAAQCFNNLDPESPGYKQYAQTLAKESSAALAKQLTDYYEAHRRFAVLTSSPHGIVYAASFNQAPDQIRWNCEKAYEQVAKIVHASYQDIGMAINGAAKSVQRYETWFGPMADGRPEKVKQNFFLILEALKTQKLVVYYRGPLPTGAMSMKDDYNLVNFFPLKQGGEEYCGMATRRSKRNLSCPDGEDLHVKLGNGVVLRGCITPTQGKNTYAGTIVHEISHIVCETRDVKLKVPDTGQLFEAKTGKVLAFTTGKALPMQDNDGYYTQTYGPVYCMSMAKHWPDKAIMNADNYCFFSEQFL